LHIIFGQIDKSSKIVLVAIAIAVCAYNFIYDAANEDSTILNGWDGVVR
jgi:hypothetical protein